MPDQSIDQKLGLDATQAIQQLGILDQSFQKFASTLTNFPSAASAFNGAAAKVTQNLKSNAAGFQGVVPTASAANAAIVKLNSNMSFLGRIAFTQAIIKGMRLVENSGAEAAKKFTSFEKILSEIQAISPGDTLENLSRDVRELSDAFNTPLLDTARAKYELISNGFTKADEQARLFAAGTKLAKLGVASQTQALDLLSTSLNAYGVSADQADRFSRGFFQAANVGKFTIAQLAANFGKAAPAAKSLGVSLEETLALFSSLTVKGVSTPEAATQINSLFASFIKPSKGMKAALNELGFASGQALIDAKSFAGALQLVTQHSGGSADALAKLFPNVRALRGLLTESNDGFKTLNAHFDSLSKLTQREFDTKFLKRMKTDSETASAAVNRLSNAWTLGFGQAIVGSAAAADRLTGKTNALAEAAENLGKVLGGGGIAAAKQGLTNFANRELSAVHEQLQQKLNENQALRSQILEKAQSLPKGSALPFGAANVAELTKTLDNAFNIGKVEAYEAKVKATLDHIAARSKAREGANPELNKEFKTALDGLTALSTKANFTDAELKTVLDKFLAVESQVDTVNEGLSFTPALEASANALESLLEKRATLGQIPAEGLNAAKAAFDAMKQTTTDNVGQASLLADQLERAARAAKEAAAANIGGSAAPAAARALGGRMSHFAAGGIAKGSDTIPAMLSQDEVVINAESSRRFSPQLQAIQAGVAPTVNHSQSSVTNIGDIVVNGTGEPELVARKVMELLRREGRRTQ